MSLLFLALLSLHSKVEIVFLWHYSFYILAAELLHHGYLVVYWVQFFGCYDLMQSYI